MRKTCTHWAGVIAGLVLAAASAHAAPPPAEVFFKQADIADVQLSPSGRQVAITTVRGHQRAGLVVFDLGSGKMSRAAHFADGDVTRVRWVNDNRLLFSLEDLSEGSGKYPGLLAVNPDGSDMRRLVSRTGGGIAKDRFSRLERLLSWNHQLLRVPLPRSGESADEVLIAHISVDEDRIATPLWLNTRTGITRKTYANAPAHTIGWLTDNRGELRAAVTEHAGRRAAYWRDPGQQDWRQLYESGLFDAPFELHSVDAAGQLYVTTALAKDKEAVLTRYDFERGAPDTQALVETPGFSFAGELLDEGGGPALGVRLVIDTETTVWFHPALQGFQQQVDEHLPGRVNRIQCRRCGQTDMTALVLSFSDRDTGQFWVYQAQPPAGEQRWLDVGRVRNDIPPAQTALMDFHRIRARDGRDLPVWVTRPADAKGPLPAVVLVHGGPWVRGNVWGWRPWGQFLASRGYVVIEPEFRGSTGYGDAHHRAGFRQWGQAMQDDVADALKWAQAQGLASAKACIAGGSYGGYSTLMGLIKDPELYRCGVAWMAVTDLDLLVSGSFWVRDDISDTGRQYRIHDLVGDPVKDADMIAAHSPVKQAERIKAPVLLGFGEKDLRVPLVHGERMRDALKKAGNEPVWITYPGEGHGFGMLKNRVDFAERMAAFLAQHLGGPAPAASK